MTRRTAEAGRPGSKPAVDPTGILQLTTAYWASVTLLAANRLGVFSLLGRGARGAAEAAADLEVSPRSLEILLDACVGQGLLVKADGLYANSPAAQSYLVRGGPAYLGDGLEYALDLVPVWGRLAESVRDGRPALPPQEILGGDPEKTRHFVLAMHNRARGVAQSLAAVLDLSGRRRLLDVGGGPGTYSVLLVGKTPGLRARVLDLPPVVEIAGDLIADSDCADRIETVAGDYHEDELPGGNDVVLMSGMMHRETPESCRSLLARAWTALEPGGLVVVSDVFFADEEKTAPPFAGLFALNMMLTSDHGAAHSVPEMSRWLADAGFSGIEARPLPPPMPHSMILGRRPETA